MTAVLFNQNPITINTIYCIGRSYVEHIHELGNAVPDEPLVFLKPNSSIITGDKLSLPTFSNNVHHETELVLLIGDNKSIAGVTVGLDLTARDVQTVCKEKGLPWLKAKGFKHACWLGEFIPFAQKSYHISLAVNGTTRQSDTTDKMMYRFDELVRYLDELYGLKKGDIIMTGTPKGVDKLERGDILSIGLDEIFYQVNVQ